MIVIAVVCGVKNEVYGAEDVHAWAERLAQGVASQRPKPWRK
jgi:hypothetical protein